jgi:hypothetical protein
LLLALPAQSMLVLGSFGTHDHIFVLSKILRVLKLGPFFDERRSLTTTGGDSSGHLIIGSRLPAF